jgi:hypothetical protein
MPPFRIFTDKPPNFGLVKRHYAFGAGQVWPDKLVDDFHVVVCYGGYSPSCEIDTCRVTERQYMLIRDIPDEMIANSDASSREELIRHFRANRHDRNCTANSVVTVFTYVAHVAH